MMEANKIARVHDYTGAGDDVQEVAVWSETRKESHGTNRNATEREDILGQELRIKPLKLFKYIKS